MNPILESLQNFAKLLRQFDLLKEFALDFDYYGEGPATPIKNALMGHTDTGLRKLSIDEGSRFHYSTWVGIKGYT